MKLIEDTGVHVRSTDDIYIRRKGKIIYQPDSTHDTPWNAQIWNWCESKRQWAYCGYGRFCKTMDEAKTFLIGVKGLETIETENEPCTWKI